MVDAKEMITEVMDAWEDGFCMVRGEYMQVSVVMRHYLAKRICEETAIIGELKREMKSAGSNRHIKSLIEMHKQNRRAYKRVESMLYFTIGATACGYEPRLSEKGRKDLSGQLVEWMLSDDKKEADITPREVYDFFDSSVAPCGDNWCTK